MQNISTLGLKGVVLGRDVQTLLDLAKVNKFAYPAVNVTSSHTINACLEAARESQSPVIIQLSYGGAAAFIGKGAGLSSLDASIQGAVAAAKYVHSVAEFYGVAVMLHTDHASKGHLPWIDGLLQASELHFERTGKPLFSSHMIDLSAEPLEENVSICCQYLSRMAPMAMTLEIELGCTGGEEDGIDNSHLDQSDLYTKPEDVAYAYERLMEVSHQFTVAAAFGNVHGVYQPGNVQLQPKILAQSQQHLQQKFALDDKPLSFVFHGGSGSRLADITEAISYGVVKMNIDTDTQWALWSGVRQYHLEYIDYLGQQIGNPLGADQPNKKFYDPRNWMRQAETSMVKRLNQCFVDLNCLNRLAVEER